MQDAGPSVPVDTAGTDDGLGGKKWDFMAALGAPVMNGTVHREALTTQWPISEFPNANFIQKDTTFGSTDIAVFESKTNLVLLHGYASDAPAGGMLMKYGTPIKFLQFPLYIGASWTSSADLTGTFNGTAYVGQEWREKHDFTVDEWGKMTVPFGTRRVLRLNHLVTMTLNKPPDVGSWTRRDFAFYAKCSGVMAGAVSLDDEQAVNFDEAVMVTGRKP
jgi:hypothetical protein